MSYTHEDTRREAEEYREWARERDREQFLDYMSWIRANAQRIKREEETYASGSVA